ncbi:MAG: cytochrome c biogenesis protein CcdA [Candidatus ainarchaeum sp.]|nr:cytochrome c biogenesis protein CcdA [Candidatus ainarchaeum sp.]MDD3084712.1 cytochrome c biogenesis protein CcdA [Candidatus ainarchaeum sp.]MDD4220961.1 cytochrome c biogenesis protein CcdA [Candidatus ainarchaeum sp.]
MKINKLFFIIVLFFSLLLIGGYFFAGDDCIDQDTNEDLCVIDPNDQNGLFPNLDFNNLNNNSVDNNSIDNVNDYICGVYFTGIGCPHCAKIDPYLFKETLPFNSNLVIIEFEVKSKRENAKLAIPYDNSYNSGLEIPFLIVNKENVHYYDSIKNNFIQNNFNNLKTNACPFPTSVYEDGDTTFNNLNLNKINGSPVIWLNDRGLERTGESDVDPILLKKLLTDQNIDSVLRQIPHKHADEKFLTYSGGVVFFDNSIVFDGWKFYFNGVCIDNDSNQTICQDSNTTNDYGTTTKPNYERLSLIKVISLALTDAVNPCAFAVLLMLLLAITTSNPKSKKKILLSGLSFALSIFIMYFLYGLIFITFFKSFSGNVSIIFYKAFAIFAVLLGLWHLKDFFYYKPGSIGTEMPMKLRPKVQRLLSKATSPRGAFVIGLFVTVFLLPCTIGPYIIATSSLAFVDLMKSMPLLLLYNLIFIIPMIVITLLIYFGFKKIQDLGEWKQKNIRYLHLISGAIILILGLLMLFGIL